MRWVLFALAALCLLLAAGVAVRGLETPASLQTRREACVSAAQEERGRQPAATGAEQRPAEPFNPPPSCLDMSVVIDDDHAEAALVLLALGIVALVAGMASRPRVRPRPRPR